MNDRKFLLPTFLLAAVIVLCFTIGFLVARIAYDPPTDLPEEFNTLGEVWQSLQDYYVNEDALDPEVLAQGAIDGLLEALDDPYTSYLNPDMYELEWSAFEGSYEGIGAFVTMEDGELIVVSPIAGGPAEENGVKAGDRILEVNGESTAGLTLTEALLLIRGPEGTWVTLLILHDGETAPIEIEILRQEIQLETVSTEMLTDEIARIHITHFSQNTYEEFVDILLEAYANGAEGIVLDLRNNPGGYLHVVVDVAGEFLDGGIVLYQENADGTVEEEKASSGGLATDLPLVVLVDEGSASGSEVLAGALQDRDRAQVVGSVTYGKGSVNLMLELSDGSALYVTTARWLTPDGHLIEGIGLTPDFEVEITEDDILNERDPQLDCAIDDLESQL